MKHNQKKYIAAGISALMLLSSVNISAYAGSESSYHNSVCLPSLEAFTASSSDASLPDELPDDPKIETIKRNLRQERASNNPETVELHVSQTQTAPTKETVSFEIKRRTDKREFFNDPIAPEPIHIVVKKNAGEEYTEVTITPSPAIRDKVTIKNQSINPNGDTLLEFDLQFTGLSVANGNFDLSAQLVENLLTVRSGQQELAVISVLYSAIGMRLYYSAQQFDLYNTKKYIPDSVGNIYAVIGTINLNGSPDQLLTLQHTYQTAKTCEYKIEKLSLYEGGDFVFEDGSTEYLVNENLVHGDKISVNLKLKPESFQRVKSQAMSKNETLIEYYALTDLNIIYNDGYEIGGRINRLPVGYAVSYTKSSSGGSSGGTGGSSGGGGGGSSSGGHSTINTPPVTARTTVATSNDKGWVLREGFWYYLDANGKDVTGWLRTTDGTWYYLDQAGRMRTGWNQVDQVWYYLSADGAMYTGWLLHEDGKWYYLGGNGRMTVGWAQVKDVWYYFHTDGGMLANTRTPDGFQLGADGAWLR